MKFFNLAVRFAGKNRRKLWFSILINAVFLCVLLLVECPYYETNDDITLQNLVNLSRDVQDAWTQTSFLFGLVLTLLYRITQQLPWYIMVLYGVMFVSLTAVTYIALNFPDGWLGGMIAAILLIFYGYQGYVVVNFTRVAGCAGAAGALLVVRGMRKEEKRYLYILIGSLLAFAGFSIRSSEALAAFGCVSPAGICLLLRLNEEEGKGRRGKVFLRYILCLVPVMALFAGGQAATVYARIESPVREAYSNYSKARIAVMDHGFPSYAANKEAFEELDINRNAYQLYKHWDFYDPEKVPVETMERIAEMQPEYRFTLETVKAFFEKYPEKTFFNPMFLIYLIVLAAAVIFGRRDRSSNLTVLYQAAFMCGVYLYLFYIRRYGVPRVESALWLGASLGLFPILEKSRSRISRRGAAVAVLFALVFAQNDYSSDYRSLSELSRSRRVNFQNYVSMLSADQEHLYIFQTNRFFPDQAYGPFDRVPAGSLNNLVPLGGWTTMSAPYLYSFESYGVRNPFRDMIGNEKVRLVTDDPDGIVRYLQDYYDASCHAKQIDTIGNNNIYIIEK